MKTIVSLDESFAKYSSQKFTDVISSNPRILRYRYVALSVCIAISSFVASMPVTFYLVYSDNDNRTNTSHWGLMSAAFAIIIRYVPMCGSYVFVCHNIRSVISFSILSVIAGVTASRLAVLVIVGNPYSGEIGVASLWMQMFYWPRHRDVPLEILPYVNLISHLIFLVPIIAAAGYSATDILGWKYSEKHDKWLRRFTLLQKVVPSGNELNSITFSEIMKSPVAAGKEECYVILVFADQEFCDTHYLRIHKYLHWGLQKYLRQELPKSLLSFTMLPKNKFIAIDEMQLRLLFEKFGPMKEFGI